MSWETAQALQKIGLKPGDRVAVIAAKGEGHWARLAKLKVVAELRWGQDGAFWAGGHATRERVFAAFAATGSRVVVVKEPPPSAANEGWVQLGETPYYAYRLAADPAPN